MQAADFILPIRGMKLDGEVPLRHLGRQFIDILNGPGDGLGCHEEDAPQKH